MKSVRIERFELESGVELRDVDVAYTTYGQMAPDASNVVWVCHALTANSEVDDWWPHTVEEGAFLDPARHFVICANFLGSCYGTTGPMSINPDTGEPWYSDFPKYTIRDVVNLHRALADKLGIHHVDTLVGSSIGGFQALEWAVMEPERFSKLIIIATDAYASPWTVALDETQRMAICSDATYGERRRDAGAAGLATARAIGLLSYRGAGSYNLTQQDAEILPGSPRRACSYQQYQGKKLVDRFDAYSYMAILDSFDTHDVGRDRGGREAALARITARTIIIGITTDIIFTPAEMRALAASIPGAQYAEIDSDFAHDGFLVEHERLNALLLPFINV